MVEEYEDNPLRKWTMKLQRQRNEEKEALVKSLIGETMYKIVREELKRFDERWDAQFKGSLEMLSRELEK